MIADMAITGEMPKKMAAGLKSYGAGKKTKDIEEDVSGKPGVDDPAALAVFIRKWGLGEAGFKRHQKSARTKAK